MDALPRHRPAARRVMLIEINEITWRLLDPLLRQGKLPHFAALLRAGTRATPLATEDPDQLDPWISWTSVYTGRPQREHHVRFLEQPPATVTGPRIWELAADAGKRIGVYGSIMSWPPRSDVDGFWVPSTFSPDTRTTPAELEPIQQLNLAATRAHSPVAGQPGPVRPAALVPRLLRLGLRWQTLAAIGSHLARSRLTRTRGWEKVSLQPLVNLDFFERLYRRYRPDFATFHTNHVAHYQHRYWRAMDSTPFHVPASPAERRQFGGAIEYGYRVADALLGRMRRLADRQTVIVVASGLGQQPYVVDEFREGRQVVRLRDIGQIVRLCGLEGHCQALSMMAPQWNLTVPDPQRRRHAEQVLASAWYRQPGTQLIAFTTMGDTINLNVFQKNLRPLDLDAECCFPDSGTTLRLGELCAVQDATPKEGCHDPAGVLIMQGPGVRAGCDVQTCSNLDLAPTMLHLLGLPIPDSMTGRVLHEALSESAAQRESVASPA